MANQPLAIRRLHEVLKKLYFEALYKRPWKGKLSQDERIDLSAQYVASNSGMVASEVRRYPNAHLNKRGGAVWDRVPDERVIQVSKGWKTLMKHKEELVKMVPKGTTLRNVDTGVEVHL